MNNLREQLMLKHLFGIRLGGYVKGKWGVLMILMCWIGMPKANSFPKDSLPPYLLQLGAFQDTLDNHSLIFLDKGKERSFSDALEALQAGYFKPYCEKEVPGKFFRGQYRFWIFFSVDNVGDHPFPLIINQVSLSYDSVFVFQQEELIDAYTFEFLGDKIETETGFMPNYGIFDYEIPPNTELSFLVGLEDYSVHKKFLPRLSDKRGYETRILLHTQRKTTAYLLLTGMMLTVVIFFGLQYLNTRDKVDCWYLLYAVAMLIISWRNLESVNPLYISTYYLVTWTQSKVFHSAAIFITYAYFIRYFLGKHTPVLIRMARWILYLCVGFMALELVLLPMDLYLSWLFYYWFRVIASLFSLVLVFFIWNSPHPLARYLLWGCLCLIVGEVISWFFPSAYSSEVALAGVFLEFILFSYAMGRRVTLDRQENMRLAYGHQLLGVEQELMKERLRTSIAQDIHDEVGASLTKISLSAQVAEKKLAPDQPVIREYLLRIESNARKAIGQMQEIIFGLYPQYDSFTELQAYFQEYAEAFWEGQPIAYHLSFPSATWNPQFSPDVKRQLLLIFKEAQNNVSRHSRASLVKVSLTLPSSDSFLLSIEDDGQGFDPTTVNHFSQGITGMSRRAKSIDASLHIESAPEKGCHIQVQGKVQSTISDESGMAGV